MDDHMIIGRVRELVDEEDAMYALGEGLTAEQVQRRRHIEAELDQCYDLLRQRRARREFGQDPDEAQVRPASQVEGYVGDTGSSR